MNSKKRLYYYTSWDYGLEAIKKKRIKISEINNLNDPNEFLGVKSSDKRLIDKFLEHKLLVSEKHGIICFSKKYNSPLMWGHYAKNHYGICLGFDVENDKESLLKVSYKKDKKEVKEIDLNKKNILNFMKGILETKYDNWSYESEYRYFSEKSKKNWDCRKDLYFDSFSEHLLLKEIILGIRTIKTTDYIRKMLSKIKFSNDVDIYKLKMDQETFNFIHDNEHNRKYSKII